MTQISETAVATAAIAEGRRDFARLLLWVGAAITAAGLIGFAQAHDLLDPTRNPFARDFVNLWTAALLLREGQFWEIFDPQSLLVYQAKLLGQLLPVHLLQHPPQTALILWPLAFLSYGGAYLAWTLATFLIFAAGLASGRRDWSMLLALAILAPASAANLLSAQTGFLLAGLFLIGLKNIDTRPVLAGICFGLMTLKPQFGLLIPFALAGGRHWRVLFITECVAALVILLGAQVFGWQAWLSYFKYSVMFTHELIAQGKTLLATITIAPFASARSAGLTPLAAELLQIAALLFAIVTARKTAAKALPNELKNAILLTTALLAAPSAANHDLTLIAAAIALVATSPIAARLDLADKLLLGFGWCLPLLVPFLQPMKLAIAPAMIAGVLLALLRLADRVERDRPA